MAESQIILELLVSRNGYLLSYFIFKLGMVRRTNDVSHHIRFGTVSFPCSLLILVSEKGVLRPSLLPISGINKLSEANSASSSMQSIMLIWTGCLFQ